MTTLMTLKNPENSGHEVKVVVECPVAFGSSQWHKLYDYIVLPGKRIELEISSGRRLIIEEDIPHAATILAKD